jgi:hypothetical protein
MLALIQRLKTIWVEAAIVTGIYPIAGRNKSIFLMFVKFWCSHTITRFYKITPQLDLHAVACDNSMQVAPFEGLYACGLINDERIAWVLLAKYQLGYFDLPHYLLLCELWQLGS